MKNYIIITVVLFASFMVFSNRCYAFPQNWNNNAQQQTSWVTGYYQSGGNWTKISIQLTQSNQQGLIVTRSSDQYRCSGYNQQVMRLNPNNQIAIQNNFTHYVDMPCGRVYFSLQ